jgi:hypothetical protein
MGRGWTRAAYQLGHDVPLQVLRQGRHGLSLVGLACGLDDAVDPKVRRKAAAVVRHGAAVDAKGHEASGGQWEPSAPRNRSQTNRSTIERGGPSCLPVNHEVAAGAMHGVLRARQGPTTAPHHTRRIHTMRLLHVSMLS